MPRRRPKGLRQSGRLGSASWAGMFSPGRSSTCSRESPSWRSRTLCFEQNQPTENWNIVERTDRMEAERTARIWFPERHVGRQSVDHHIHETARAGPKSEQPCCQEPRQIDERLAEFNQHVSSSTVFVTTPPPADGWTKPRLRVARQEDTANELHRTDSVMPPQRPSQTSEPIARNRVQSDECKVRYGRAQRALEIVQLLCAVCCIGYQRCPEGSRRGATYQPRAALAVSPQDFPWAGMSHPFGATRRRPSRLTS